VEISPLLVEGVTRGVFVTKYWQLSQNNQDTEYIQSQTVNTIKISLIKHNSVQQTQSKETWDKIGQTGINNPDYQWCKQDQILKTKTKTKTTRPRPRPRLVCLQDQDWDQDQKNKNKTKSKTNTSKQRHLVALTFK